jgi:holo-[acyl-carrier protein] synthase
MTEMSTTARATTMARSSIVVGLDLVQVSAIAHSVERFGSRFLDRIYTLEELRYCLADASTRATRLAARFAAKEAVLKVLRSNDEAISWRSIEVARTRSGACDIVLGAEAQALARAAGITGLSLSMTHEADYASAVVVGERARAGETE